MPVVTAVAMYFVIWWIALFAVLPLGTRPVADADSQSGWRGAPEKPQMLRKALITTVVAAIIWAGLYGIIVSGWIDFRTGWWALPN
jgi:predicted secreted protein